MPPLRHCERREAIQRARSAPNKNAVVAANPASIFQRACRRAAGLLRCARNDGWGWRRALNQRLVKIIPVRVQALDQRDLPLAAAGLELLLPRDRLDHAVVQLVPDERLAAVSF